MEYIIKKGEACISRLFDPNLPLDQMIPRSVLLNAHGLVYISTVKIGCGVTCKVGKGFLMAKGKTGEWGPPLAIGLRGFGFGAKAGGESVEYVVVLNSNLAVEAFLQKQMMFGTDMELVVGPKGRTKLTNRSSSAKINQLHENSPMNFTYSNTIGVFGGVGLHGDMINIRERDNRKFYGWKVPHQVLLNGEFDYRKSRNIVKVVNQLTNLRSPIKRCSSCKKENEVDASKCLDCRESIVHLANPRSSRHSFQRLEIY